MVSRTFDLGSLETYKYVVVLSEYNGKILLSRHKDRTTWETQGGHIEDGETPLDAAKRELYEKSGAIDFDIEPLCDYRAWNEDTGHGANGVVFKAIIRELGNIPESEMAEVQTFDSLPNELTYPAITPVLFRYLETGQNSVVLHRMKLKAEPFRKIGDGLKMIELRLNDEKRQNVQIGDYIEFTLMDDTSQKLTTRVVALHHFRLSRKCMLRCRKKNSAILPMKRLLQTTWTLIIRKRNRKSTVHWGLKLSLITINEHP